MYSHSKVNCYKQCPKLFEYKYIRRLAPIEESPALAIGKGFHKCIELNDVDLALEWMDEQTDFLNESAETDKIIAASMGEAFLKKYPDHNKGNIRHEVYITHTLPNGEVVQLYLDGLLELDEGYIIREYKTSSRVDDTYLAKLSFNDQISRYWSIIEKELKKPILYVDYYVAKKPLLRQKKDESITQYRERLVERLMEDDNIINITLNRTREELDEAYNDLIYDIDVIKNATRYTKNLSACSAYGTCPYMQLCMGSENALAGFIEKEEIKDGVTREQEGA
jgi:hypothetical protein